MVSFVFGCAVEMEKVEETIWVVAVSPTRLCPRLSRCQDPELERGLKKQPPSQNWPVYLISIHIGKADSPTKNEVQYQAAASRLFRPA